MEISNLIIVIFSEMELFCAAILLSICYYIATRKTVENRTRRIVLLHIYTLSALGFIADTLWSVCAHAGPLNRFVMHLLMSVKFLSYTFAAMFWLIFCELELNLSIIRSRKRIALLTAPAFASALLILLNPFTNWIFKAYNDLSYERGELYFVYRIIYYAYVLMATILVLINSKDSNSEFEKKYNYRLAFYSVPVLALGLIQDFTGFFGFNNLGITIGLIFVFIEFLVEKSSVLQEMLSGLSEPFVSAVYINLETDTVIPCRLSKEIEKMEMFKGGNTSVNAALCEINDKFIYELDRMYVMDNLNIMKIRQELENNPFYSLEFRTGPNDKIRYLRAIVIRVDRPIGKADAVIGFRYIDEEVKEENQRKEAREREARQNYIIKGLTEDFECVDLVDFNTDEIVQYRQSDLFTKYITDWDRAMTYTERTELFADSLVVDEDRNKFLLETSADYVMDALEKSSACFVDYRVLLNGKEYYFQSKFMNLEYDPSVVILGIHNIDIAIRRELGLEARRDHEETVKKLSAELVSTLANTIDAKDKYTNGHSGRVAEYSVMIAKKLGMSDAEQKHIQYLAALHDVGKIGVPDEIINKPDRLTGEEYELIKKHTLIGADVLKNITAMPDLYAGARWHHERYDGRGYPDGLKGDNIPLAARIISVADSYDAMTSNRGYRKAFNQAKVRSEILNGSGTQYDPVLADIMVKIIDEDKDFMLRECEE